MKRNHPGRVEKLSGRMGLRDDNAPFPTADFIAMLNACVPDPKDGQPFPSEDVYRCACRKANPRLRWPTYSEMCEIWRETDKRIAEDHARWAAAALPPGTRIGDKVY